MADNDHVDVHLLFTAAGGTVSHGKCVDEESQAYPMFGVLFCFGFDVIDMK